MAVGKTRECGNEYGLNVGNKIVATRWVWLGLMLSFDPALRHSRILPTLRPSTSTDL